MLFSQYLSELGIERWDHVLPTRDLHRGNAELLVLALLSERDMYGYEIIHELHERSFGYFNLEEGLLYPTLHRLEHEGLAVSEWRTVNGRRRRYYAITGDGRRALESASRDWEKFAEQFLKLVAPGNRRRDVKPES